MFSIDLYLKMGLMLYSKWVDVFNNKLIPVSHLTMNYFQSYLFQFTRCNKIMKYHFMTRIFRSIEIDSHNSHCL